MVYKQQNASWRVRSGDKTTKILMQTVVYPTSQNIEASDGEATECRLCKQCGCMLNTDYM